MKTGLALVVSASLCACGGGGGGSSAGLVEDPEHDPGCKAVVVVQLFGDSVQVDAYQWGYLQHELDERFGFGHVLLELNAVSGTNSRQLRTGTDGFNPPWPKSVNGDIVMVNHGLNDQANQVPMDEYAENMRTFAYLPRNVVIETPTPIAHFLNVPDAPWAEIARQAAVEAHKPVADAQAYVLSRPYWETELWDGIHPTHELQQAIAHNVTAPALAPIIAKMLCR